MKIVLYEKSYHKSLFLKEVSRKLNLNTEIIQKDIFSFSKLATGTIIARAFKPLPVVLRLVYENFSNYKNLIMFMGKSGTETLKTAQLEWDFKFIKKTSLTSKDAFLLNIENIKRIEN